MGTSLLQRDGSRGDWGVYPLHRIKYGAGSNPLPSRAIGSFATLRTNGGRRDGPDLGRSSHRHCYGDEIATLRSQCTGANSHSHPSPLPSRERGLVRHATLAMTGGNSHPHPRIKYGAGSNPLPSRERGTSTGSGRTEEVGLRTNGGERDEPDFGPQQGPALLRRRDCHATLAMTGGNSHPHPSPLPSRERGLVRHATLAMTGGNSHPHPSPLPSRERGLVRHAKLAMTGENSHPHPPVSSTGQAPTLSHRGRGGPSTSSGRTEVGSR